jgi:UDP-N-acetylmuramate dehydrogenase
LIGEGSNILFTADFDGLVIVNRLKGISVQETADAWLLHVAAGENWPALIQWTLQHQMPGMENLALIPGTVGAAPVQNIGAYGVEFCQFCEYVDTWHFADGHRQRYSAAACQFGYRDSLFKHELHDQVIITAVGLRIPKQWQPVVEYGPLKALGANATAEQIFMTVCELRQSKLPDPTLLGNAGSFFKNPVVSATQAAALKQQHPAVPCFSAGEDQNKLAAGWLIDKAGLKGFSVGNAGVHRDQALVLVNLGNASAAEILQLAKHVANTVKQQFAVQLEPEVRFIGSAGEINSLQAIQ